MTVFRLAKLEFNTYMNEGKEESELIDKFLKDGVEIKKVQDIQVDWFIKTDRFGIFRKIDVIASTLRNFLN